MCNVLNGWKHWTMYPTHKLGRYLLSYTIIQQIYFSAQLINILSNNFVTFMYIII